MLDRDTSVTERLEDDAARAVGADWPHVLAAGAEPCPLDRDVGGLPAHRR